MPTTEGSNPLSATNRDLLDAGVGALSPPLRQMVETLETQSQAIAQRMIVTICGGIAEYGQISETSTLRDVQESVLLNVRLWFSALLSGQPPDGKDLDLLAAYGRRRVHQGVAIQALLQAYRTGSRVLWDVLLETAAGDRPTHDELLFKVSPYILMHFDLIGRTVGQAYAEEQHQRARWRERLQHELCGVIFSHPDDADSFREHALALGLDANASHLALALRMTPAARSRITPEAGLDPLMDSVCRTLGLSRDKVLYTLRNAHLLLWVPMPAGIPASEAEQQLAKLAEQLGSGGHDIAACGIGLPDAGARGWRRSADQAFRALDLGLRLDPQRRAHRYLEIAIDDALQTADNAMRFFEGWMARLAPEPQLIKTLEAFFEHHQHRKAVAGALNIHPNTLSYRLERIENILGVRLDEVGWLTRLHAALRLRQLSAPSTAK